MTIMFPPSEGGFGGEASESDPLAALDFDPDLDADDILRQHLVEQYDQHEFYEKLHEARRFDKEYERVIRDDQRAQEFLNRVVKGETTEANKEDE